MLIKMNWTELPIIRVDNFDETILSSGLQEELSRFSGKRFFSIADSDKDAVVAEAEKHYFSVERGSDRSGDKIQGYVLIKSFTP